MSVLIKGALLPQRCEACPLCHEYQTVGFDACGCKVKMKTRERDCTTRPVWCPLVEVPDKHGRLIDVSKKIKVQTYNAEYEEFDLAEMTIDEFLLSGFVEEEIPTIIPAEECE